MSQRVIVTGAGGLIGKPVVKALRRRGYHVIGFAHGPSDGDATGISVDLLNAEARRRALEQAQADSLVHLAWFGGRDRWNAPENALWAQATLALARDFQASGGKRAVFAGSCAEYDWHYSHLAETSPLRPSTPYGHAKAQARQSLLTAPDLSMSLVWARIFFCFGPGEPPGRLMGDLIRGLLANAPVLCTDGEQVRDFLHIDDVADALAHLLASDIEGDVNIGSGQGTAVRDLITQTAEAIGRPELIRLGARIRPADDPPVLIADVTRLAGCGFTPSHTLAEGIQATLDAERGRSR